MRFYTFCTFPEGLNLRKWPFSDVVSRCFCILLIWYYNGGVSTLFFIDTTDKTLKSIVDYRNSAKGILDNITENAKDNSQALQESFDILQNDEALKEAKKFVEVYHANN